MAMAIIDALEVVEIHQRQHERPPLAVQLPEPFIQEAAIIKTGQCIPVGGIVRRLQAIGDQIQLLVQLRYLREIRQYHRRPLLRRAQTQQAHHLDKPPDQRRQPQAKEDRHHDEQSARQQQQHNDGTAPHQGHRVSPRLHSDGQ